MPRRRGRQTRSSSCSSEEAPERGTTVVKANPRQEKQQEFIQEDKVINFRFPPFDPTLEDWEYYILRLENEFLIHGLMEERYEIRRCCLFLARVGPQGFKILVDHFRPKTVYDVKYAELKLVLYRYYGQSTCIFAERLAFSSCSREEGEKINTFLAKLRALAHRCEFGSSLEERLRDQLVIGVNETSWQQEVMKTHPSNAATLQQVEATLIAMEQVHIQQNRMKKLTVIENLRTNRVEMPATSLPKHGGKKTFEMRRGQDCLFCGGRIHRGKETCPALGKVCSACQARNHFARACITSGRAVVLQPNAAKQQNKHKARNVNLEREESSDTDWDGQQNINTVSKGNKGMLEVELNGRKVEMLYDPGACQSVINKQLWKDIGSPKLIPSKSLTAYTDVEISTLGKTTVTVKAFGKKKWLELYVVEAYDVPLFGFSWTLAFDLPLPPGLRICKVHTEKKQSNKEETRVLPQLIKLKQEFQDLFREGLGTVKDYKAKVHIREGAVPKMFKPRPVPFAVKAQLETELNRLVEMGVLEPVDPFTTPIEWSSPIVVAPKPDGKIRVCADFKVTLNPNIILDRHPLPRFEDILAKLSGGQEFTTIDLKDAYLQIEVDDSCKKYFIISTHKGYFMFRRLPFGISSAPAIFQRIMDMVLSGLDGVACYLDDIVITGKNKEEHLKTLKEVLQRLRRWGMRVKEEKCKWLQASITYLGHRLDKSGINPTEEHLKAIRNMPDPKTQKELRAFLGSVNSKFVPHLQSCCAPLHGLLRKHARWEWTSDDAGSVEKIKNCIIASPTLVHFNPDKPTIVTADASETGIGAVLMQRQEDGSEHPVAFVSRTLQPAEKRYSSIDREALALIFAVTKFHQYIYGRCFTLRTDHRPLQHLLGEEKEIPKTAASRISRWALLLSAYIYKIEYLPGKSNTVADALSRLPIQEVKENGEITQTEKEDRYLLQMRLQDFPVTKRMLQKDIQEDLVLREVIKFIEKGWPDKGKNVGQEMQHYYEKRDELSYEEGILMYNGRIVAPGKSRQRFLRMLHEGHPGIVAMKSIAKFQVWWPGMTQEIENYVKTCTPCQQTRPKEAEAPLFSWSIPTEPWSRIHIDYAGPVEGKNWLIIVDAFTKWVEILPTKLTTAATTINLLRPLFSRLGVPRTIVSDNGPQFTSVEFGGFCKKNLIKHIKITPYHPKSNGLAERAVRTFKGRFKASGPGERNLRLCQILLAYRNSIHPSTGRTPAELMFGRSIRTCIDILKPSVENNIDRALTKQKLTHDQKAKERSFEEGDLVWVKKPLAGGYLPGTVIRKTGPLSYWVQVEGEERRHHADQLRSRRGSEADMEPRQRSTEGGEE